MEKGSAPAVTVWGRARWGNGEPRICGSSPPKTGNFKETSPFPAPSPRYFEVVPAAVLSRSRMKPAMMLRRITSTTSISTAKVETTNNNNETEQ